MKRINLLPPEIAQRQLAHRRAMALVIAGAALVAVFAIIYAFQSFKVGALNREADSAEARASSLEGQVRALNEVAALQAQIADKEKVVAQLMQGDVAFSRLLTELSMVIPGDAWITAFNATASSGQPAAAPAAGAVALTKLGTLSYSGVVFDFPGVAKWITRLSELPTLTNVWVSTANKGKIAERDVVNFSSTSDLSDKAASNRYEPETAP